MKRFEKSCECGSAISKNANQCKRCSNIKNSPFGKKSLPPDEQILLMLTKGSAESVAKKLGVSVNTIRHIKLKYK